MYYWYVKLVLRDPSSKSYRVLLLQMLNMFPKMRTKKTSLLNEVNIALYCRNLRTISEFYVE